MKMAKNTQHRLASIKTVVKDDIQKYGICYLKHLNQTLLMMSLVRSDIW